MFKSVINDPILSGNMIIYLLVAAEQRKMEWGPEASLPAPGKASWTSPSLGIRYLIFAQNTPILCNSYLVDVCKRRTTAVDS